MEQYYQEFLKEKYESLRDITRALNDVPKKQQKQASPSKSQPKLQTKPQPKPQPETDHAVNKKLYTVQLLEPISAPPIILEMGTLAIDRSITVNKQEPLPVPAPAKRPAPKKSAKKAAPAVMPPVAPKVQPDLLREPVITVTPKPPPVPPAPVQPRPLIPPRDEQEPQKNNASGGVHAEYKSGTVRRTIVLRNGEKYVNTPVVVEGFETITIDRDGSTRTISKSAIQSMI